MAEAMTEEKTPTAHKLAAAMVEAGCPMELVKNAREYLYDDYKSTHETPCILLVDHLKDFPELRKRAMNSEFDAQGWEADAWSKTPEYESIMKDLFKGKL